MSPFGSFSVQGDSLDIEPSLVMAIETILITVAVASTTIPLRLPKAQGLKGK